MADKFEELREELIQSFKDSLERVQREHKEQVQPMPEEESKQEISPQKSRIPILKTLRPKPIP
jgi:hypothetical protein